MRNCVAASIMVVGSAGAFAITLPTPTAMVEPARIPIEIVVPMKDPT